MSTIRPEYKGLLIATFPPEKVAALIRRVGSERARQDIGAHPTAWKDLMGAGVPQIAALSREEAPDLPKTNVRGSPAGTPRAAR